jgi:hypothetical protein
MSDEDIIRETYSGVVGYHKALEKKASEERGKVGVLRGASETTVSGIETEEEGGETDDEPTIRAHSSAGSETQSLSTAESDVYSEDEAEEDERDGCTPERGSTENEAAMSP